VIRSLVVVVAIVVLTLWHTLRVLVASVFGVPDREGSVYRRAPVDWGRQLCRIAGVRVIAHGQEHLADGRSCVLVANHLSWFDIFALGAVLPRMNFVAKAELRRIPLFGRAAERSGQIFIERENRKAAFAGLRRVTEFHRLGDVAHDVVPRPHQAVFVLVSPVRQQRVGRLADRHEIVAQFVAVANELDAVLFAQLFLFDDRETVPRLKPVQPPILFLVLVSHQMMAGDDDIGGRVATDVRQ
jgi:hypothetical protein